jgi:hypothetical protein
MYTQQEASEIRQQFWTTLGQYLSPIPSASGEKVNWVNYKTGVKGIRFRMDAQNKYSFVAIEIRAEEEQRLRFYQTFLSLRNQLPEYFEWMENGEDELGKPLSRIWCEKNGPTLFNKQHWPELISFFKENILLLDLFWAENKDIFEMMS